MKRFFLVFFSISLIAILAFQLDFRKTPKGSCAFCNPDILGNQVFYEGEKTLGILTHKPATDGHVLIAPKRHVERFEDLTAQEFQEMAEAIKKIDRVVRKRVGNTDYVLLQKNGKKAGQSVPHVHFHYLPGVSYLPAKYLLSYWVKPLQAEELIQLKNSFIADLEQSN